MHITAHLDVDVVAVETEDEVSVLVELTAPSAPAADPGAARPARTLQVVLDRSGSMAGDRIQGAVASLLALVDRLDPADNFGLVTFNSSVELAVPARPLRDKPAVKRAIAAVYADGNTDLSAGYLRGVQEARRVVGDVGGTVLLISDGHANTGIVDPEQLRGIAGEAHRHGVTTTTLGWGLGYDERIMSAIARGGSGNELFAENSDTAVGLIGHEVEGLLTLTAQAAHMVIRPSSHVSRVRVINDLPTTATDDGVMAELGSFYDGETRKLVLTFAVPALAALGLTEIATLVLSYVELPAAKQHTITVPLHVNVVPGDQAAGRITDPTVRTEVVYQQVQEAKRRASGHLTAGNSEAAMSDIHEAQELLKRQMSSADTPAGLMADLAEEEQSLKYMAAQTESGNLARISRWSSMDSTYKSSHRGRSRSPLTRPPTADDPDDPTQP
jgi:Ca-activated chloride channel family protein